MTSPPRIDPDPADLGRRLAEIGLHVPEICLPGVAASLMVLRDHMDTLRELPLDDRVPLALDYSA